ncbi:MAG: hypothetical protein Ct9H90mP25_0510 [Gammaproteobacteria bacterium]|nr:MAG: hypothetical protein Ct9H90mP25_0510 [Gammaproteobacteria bacterium]
MRFAQLTPKGPEQYDSHGFPILSNKKGGVSGKGIMSAALERGLANTRSREVPYYCLSAA